MKQRGVGAKLATGVVTAFTFVWLSQANARATPHLQVVGESSLGYTDNAQATPRADTLRTKSAFWMLSPGVNLALEEPRSLQRIGYRYEYDFYFNSGASSSSSNRFDYRGFFDLSRRVTLVLGATTTLADRFTSVAFAAPGAGAVGALPVGTGSFLQAAADESTSIDVAEGYRAWQSGSGVFETPIFDTQGPELSSVAWRLGAERSFFADAAGLEARGDYSVVSGGVDAAGAPLGVQRQLTGGGVALWRHDWGRYVSSSAEAGALRVQRLNVKRGFWTPIGGASLSYATERGDAQLAYAHTISVNTLLGQSLLVDELRLRGELPLTPEGELALATTCGYQRGRLLDENAELATRVSVLLADVSLGWQATKLLALGIRYEHIQQKSGAQAPPLPVSFVQNNVLVGATLKFPSERDMPRPYRAPRRVDRSDELRDGIQARAEGPQAPGGGAR
jgi:hypothetical protein